MVAAGPTRPPAAIEDFLWNVHTVLVAAQPQPLALDNLKDAYSKQLGHKCAIERFLVVGEGGLAVTLKRIPHIVTLYQDGDDCTRIKPSLADSTTKQGLIDADLAYRRELVKRNAEAAKAMGKAKTKVAPATAPKAPTAVAAPIATAPAEEAGEDGKKKVETNAETLSRMLVQGVVRVVQNRQKAGNGPLPLDELEEEFKALWKVPFNLQQAGEKDAVTFLRKWPNKVELQQDGARTLIQLSKKAPGDKPKAKSASPPPAAVPANAQPGAPPAKAAPATAPKAAAPGVPTSPPATIEEFLWNLHSVLEAFGPLPIDKLKDTYAQHFQHKFAIERFLVVGDGGLAATLKRIQHVVTVVQERDGASVKATQPAGTTREGLVEADLEYRRQLQQKNAAAKAVAAKPAPATAAKATPAAPKATAVDAAAAGQKRPAADGAGGDLKRTRPEDADTLAKMLMQGVVRVLQNRVKEGRGALPLANLEEEFKALWKVPFNLQQAGETDTLEFLQKWQNKVEVVNDGTQQVVQLAKKASEKAKALAVTAPVAKSAPAAAPPAADLSMQTLPEVRRQAASMLQAMQDMMRQQEAFVEALNQLGASS